MTRRVVILQETLPQYRVELFHEIKRRASERDIRVEIAHGRAPGERGYRLNTGTIPDALTVSNHYLRLPGRGANAVWQTALRHALTADLVIVEQASRLLINYVLLLAQRVGGPSVAFWGHGRNLQARDRSFSEAIKSRLITAPHWWFAYTEQVATYVAEAGFQRDHITVIGNTLDVTAIRKEVERIREQGLERTAGRCAYLGGLYSHKRLDVLFAAADLIAAEVTDFELLIAGDGEDRELVRKLAGTRPWAQYIGSVVGPEKAELLASSQLLLMPGLLGLVLLDSFAAGTPVVTTRDALHSPEIEYLDDGINGVLVSPSDASSYAQTVVDLLRDPCVLGNLQKAAKASAEDHTVDQAAASFVEGIDLALKNGERK